MPLSGYRALPCPIISHLTTVHEVRWRHCSEHKTAPPYWRYI